MWLIKGALSWQSSQCTLSQNCVLPIESPPIVSKHEYSSLKQNWIQICYRVHFHHFHKSKMRWARLWSYVNIIPLFDTTERAGIGADWKRKRSISGDKRKSYCLRVRYKTTLVWAGFKKIVFVKVEIVNRRFLWGNRKSRCLRRNEKRLLERIKKKHNFLGELKQESLSRETKNTEVVWVKQKSYFVGRYKNTAVIWWEK